MARAIRFGGLGLLSLLLSGCLGCIGGSEGIVSVGVIEERLVAYEAADDFELGYIVEAGYESLDLGATWTAIAVEELPAYDELPTRQRRRGTSIYEPGEWCGSAGCYVAQDLSLTMDDGATVLWQPPTGRAEFVGRAKWEARGGPLGCTPDRNRPMRLTHVAGGIVAGAEVVIVGAGPDGVLLRRGDDAVQRVGMGRWQPREWTKPLSGVANSELLPIAIVSIVSVLAMAAVLGRSPAHEEAAPERNLRKYPLLVASGSALLGLLGLVATLLLAFLTSGFWLPVVIVGTLGAWADGRRRMISPGPPPTVWLVGALWIPFLAGWVPLAGWTIGTPDRLSTAFRLGVVLAIVSGAALSLWVHRRYGPQSGWREGQYSSPTWQQ